MDYLNHPLRCDALICDIVQNSVFRTVKAELFNS